MLTQPVVLVVDDDPRNRKLAHDVLELAGFRVLEAATGEEAIDLARSHLPSLVLLDLRLPDFDGTEAMRRLRDGPSTSGIPVVALTAVADARQALLDAGFAGYIAKPIDVETLPAEARLHISGC
jgi:two-component system, cell cycle response regulator DivK